MTQSRRMILGVALLLEFPILDDIVNPIVLIHAGAYIWVIYLMIAVMPVTKKHIKQMSQTEISK